MSAEAVQSALEVDGVRAVFGGVAALQDVTFSVDAGAVHGVIGPNGAGKTTLMNVISGFVRPTAGSVHLNGQSILGLRAWRRVRAGIGRTFQTPVLIDQMTVLENVESGLVMRGGKSPLEDVLLMPRAVREGRTRRKIAYEVVGEIGLAPWANEKVARLPLGKRKIVDLGRACAARPSVLLLDEPTAGLGDDEIEAVARVLEDVRRSSTVVLVAHHLEFVLNLADRVTVLDFGRVIADGTPDEVQANPDVIKAYLGEELEGAAPAGAGSTPSGPAETVR